MKLNLNKVKGTLGNKEVKTINTSNTKWKIPKHITNETNWRAEKRKLFLGYAEKIVDSGKLISEEELNRTFTNFFLDYQAFFITTDFKQENFITSRSSKKEKRDNQNRLYKALLEKSKNVLEDSKLKLSEIK